MCPLCCTVHVQMRATHSMRSKKLTIKKVKIFSEKFERDLGMACHAPPLKKAQKTWGNATTHPQSHPISKF